MSSAIAERLPQTASESPSESPVLYEPPGLCESPRLEDWTLSEEIQSLSQIKAWENVLARKDFCLTNPADRRQVLYCYAEKRPAAGGAGQWHKRYGGSVQANPALLSAWTPRDGWTDENGRIENLVATLARVFREAKHRARPRKQLA